MKKIKLSLTIVLIMCVILAVGILASSYINEAKQLGELLAKNKVPSEEKSVVAEVNFENSTHEITSEDVKAYMIIAEFRGEKISEVEALDRLILENSKYLIALGNGYDVEQGVVDKYISESMATIEEDDEASAFLMNYLGGMGISEKEYWEITTVLMHKTLVIGKYQNEVLKSKMTKAAKSDTLQVHSKEYNQTMKKMFDDIIQSNIDSGALKVVRN